jgi:hypothetical protein
MMIMAEPPHRNVMTLRKNDFKLRHDWPDFDGLRGTILAQAIFSPAELSISSAKSYYFDRSMISHLRGAVPKQLSKKDLARTFQTQLISNAHNSFRYFPKDQRRISFSKAAKNTDVDFMRELYGIYLRRVLPLHPKMMITSSGETSSPVFLAQRWIENALQIFFRLEKLGLPASSVIDELVDELQRVTRAREESSANIAGTCEPESSKLLYIP